MAVTAARISGRADGECASVASLSWLRGLTVTLQLAYLAITLPHRDVSCAGMLREDRSGDPLRFLIPSKVDRLEGRGAAIISAGIECVDRHGAGSLAQQSLGQEWA